MCPSCPSGSRSSPTRRGRRDRDRRERVERSGAEEVVGEELHAIEAGDLARLNVREEGDRVRGVEVEREREEEELRYRAAVERRPRLELRQLQRAILGRERVGGDPLIDPGRVRREHLVD